MREKFCERNVREIFQHSTTAEENPSCARMFGNPRAGIGSNEITSGKTLSVNRHLRRTQVESNALGNTRFGKST